MEQQSLWGGALSALYAVSECVERSVESVRVDMEGFFHKNMGDQVVVLNHYNGGWLSSSGVYSIMESQEPSKKIVVHYEIHPTIETLWTGQAAVHGFINVEGEYPGTVIQNKGANILDFTYAKGQITYRSLGWIIKKKSEGKNSAPEFLSIGVGAIHGVWEMSDSKNKRVGMTVESITLSKSKPSLGGTLGYKDSGSLGVIKNVTFAGTYGSSLLQESMAMNDFKLSVGEVWTPLVQIKQGSLFYTNTIKLGTQLEKRDDFSSGIKIEEITTPIFGGGKGMLNVGLALKGLVMKPVELLVKAYRSSPDGILNAQYVKNQMLSMLAYGFGVELSPLSISIPNIGGVQASLRANFTQSSFKQVSLKENASLGIIVHVDGKEMIKFKPVLDAVLVDTPLNIVSGGVDVEASYRPGVLMVNGRNNKKWSKGIEGFLLKMDQEMTRSVVGETIDFGKP